MKKSSILLFSLLAFTMTASKGQDIHYQRAEKTLKTIEKLYAVNDGTNLYRENYPYDDTYTATYLGGGANENKANPYSYLWPFSGSLSAYTILLEKNDDATIKSQIDNKILLGLEQYYDKRQPAAYASYVKFAPQSDRFYDDNIWLGIDFLDLYLHTREKKYLDKSVEIWKFVESGMDDKLGGGIYWMEQKKESKNTCSNAPAVVYLMKLYQSTQDKKYLSKAQELYTWTKTHLQDPQDKVYWDNINLDGKIDKAKYPYNSGQMIQAASLLYHATQDAAYLKDAQEAAIGSYNYFFDASKKIKSNNAEYPALKRSNNWFIAVMFRGYVELFFIDKNKEFIDAFRANLDHAWTNMRDSDGLFGKNWHGENKPVAKKWLLDQFALVEMYARISNI